MFRQTERLRIAVIGTNNDTVYSGGRYLGLILAYVFAAAGGDVHVITNKKPIFLSDLEPIAPGGVRYNWTTNFRDNLPDGPFDYVLIIPTGVFLPNFYEAAMDFARSAGAGARVALLNFETAPWFNAHAPVPRNPRYWDYWSRVTQDGALVLSSTLEAERHARTFYHRVGGPIRFEVFLPPINSRAADEVAGREKDGSVICFVRTSDPHKGAEDLLALDPALFGGRILRLVSGGPIEPDFIRRLAEATARVPGAGLETHVGVSDNEKFGLIARAQALLFPSRFEGFGYPPVEAAYAGTEIACYDLPILQETVGPVAHMAPLGDVAALGASLREALAQPERREALHGQVAQRVSIAAAGTRLMDVLYRSLEAVPPLAPARFAAEWGPWATDAVAEQLDEEAEPFPPYLASAELTGAGEVFAEFVVATRGAVADLVCTTAQIEATDLHVRILREQQGWTVSGIVALLPAEMLDRELGFEVRDTNGLALSTFALRLRQCAPATSASVEITAAEPAIGGGCQLSGLVRIAEETPADAIAITANGRRWSSAVVKRQRFTIRCDVVEPQLSGITVLVFSGERAVAVLGGFPPHTSGRRSETFALVRAERRRWPVANLTDTNWKRGVMRRPNGQHLGTLLLSADPGQEQPKPGQVVKLGSGLVRRVIDTRKRGAHLHVVFDEALSPTLDGHPAVVEQVQDDNSQLAVVLENRDGWIKGVWRGNGPINRRGVLIRKAEDLAVERGGALRTKDNGYHIVQSVHDQGDALAVWVDRPISQRFIEEAALSYSPNVKIIAIQWAVETGSCQNKLSPRRYLNVVKDDNSRELRLGDVLEFGNGVRRYIVAVHEYPDQMQVVLDAAVDDASATAKAYVLDRDIGQVAESSLLYPSPVKARAAEPRNCMAMYRRRGERSPLSRVLPREAERPRILVATLVPPLPADQGNRVVIRNLLAHIVRRGFDIDMLLVGDILPSTLVAEFGDRVRVFSWPFPDWAASESSKVRQSIAEAIRSSLQAGLFASPERGIADNLLWDALSYHPYFIVPDEIIHLAKSLYASVKYDGIVCNYTHMIRVAKELEAIAPLPPVAVITHDALSRLPFDFNGVPIDLMYRYCAPEVERDVLNSLDGAAVVAISTTERDYFRSIGVCNKTILCEYDGLQEYRRYQVNETNFDAKAFIFAGSSNPLNIASLDWFAENCWHEIITAVPEAKLLVCGKVSTSWSSNLPGIEFRGVLPRNQLLELLHRCSISINPTVAGTGLKIKTVEAACMGMPSVCLPLAVEGLEEICPSICRKAETAHEFSAACIELATDRRAWLALHRSALAATSARFNEDAIYRELDAHMGWDVGIEERHTRPRPAYRRQAIVLDTEAPTGEHELDRLRAIAEDLYSLGQPDLALPLLEQQAARQDRSAASCLAAIGMLHLADGSIAPAIGLALQRLAESPGDVLAYDHMIRGLFAAGHSRWVRETFRLASLAAPLSPDLEELRKAIWSDDTEASSDDSIYPVRLDAEGAVTDWVEPGQPLGLGWSACEAWGCWTNGPYARLRLSLPETVGRLELALCMIAASGGSSERQVFRLLCNGVSLGNFTMDRAETTPQMITATFSDGNRKTDHLTLEFFIEDPAPFRAASGAILDFRNLGVALLSYRVSRLPDLAVVAEMPAAIGQRSRADNALLQDAEDNADARDRRLYGTS